MAGTCHSYTVRREDPFRESTVNSSPDRPPIDKKNLEALWKGLAAVSYTHLDVYKRQVLCNFFLQIKGTVDSLKTDTESHM